MGSRASKAEEERASKRKSEKQNVCPIHSPYCKLPSRPPWNSSLSWRCLRIVDDESLREVAKDIQGTHEWDDVKGEVTGLEDAVKEASTHKYFNYALLAMGGITLLVALFGYCGAKKREPVPPLPLQHLCLHHPLLQIAAIV